MSYHNFTKEYLSLFSAAEVWDLPYFKAILAPTIEKTNPVDIWVSKYNKRDLKAKYESEERRKRRMRVKKEKSEG
jgi:hypothetical protein